MCLDILRNSKNTPNTSFIFDVIYHSSYTFFLAQYCILLPYGPFPDSLIHALLLGKSLYRVIIYPTLFSL